MLISHPLNNALSIAPMLDLTDRHYRYFMRQISKNVLLYSEMYVDEAILHGNKTNMLAFNEEELPLVIQLGGSNPNKLAQASKIAASFGYSAINLNVGCPSSKVQSGAFGACLMQHPQLVVDCLKAMQDSVTIPVSIKHRIGINANTSYESLRDFVGFVWHNSGCQHFIIHARNALLNGLSPKQNRTIPPLNYDYVYRLKSDFSNLHIVINGGITTNAELPRHLEQVNGVMIGRMAYNNPYAIMDMEQTARQIATKRNWQNQQQSQDAILTTPLPCNKPTRKSIAYSMIKYLTAINQQHWLKLATKHMTGLYYGCKIAKQWRHSMTIGLHQQGADAIVNYASLLESLPDDL